MKTILLLLATLTLPIATTYAQSLKLVGTPERRAMQTPFPVLAGENVAMEMLLMPDTDMQTVRADLVQLAGTIAAPLDITVTVEPAPHDARLALVRFTAPKVKRITRLRLRLTDQTAWPIIVFPSSEEREDRPVLADLLKSSRQHLLVCGASQELRDFLANQHLTFEDLGPDAPRRLRDDEVLLGEVASRDWSRLTAPDAEGRLIVTLDDPALLPGIYITTRPSGLVCKITQPLYSLLPDNPQARETLTQLLLTALTPETR